MSEGHLDMKVHKSFLTNKIGPLPTWAWMLIGLGIAITISVVRSDKTAGDKKATDQSSGTLSGGTTGGSVQEIGGNQRPPVVTQLFNTSIFQPPTGGRSEPPACPPPPQPACSGPQCPTLPPECRPEGQWVRLESSCGPGGSQSWSSSLLSIARHFGLGDVGAIWNDPHNAQLKQRRKDPARLHAGDQIWVPVTANCAPMGGNGGNGGGPGGGQGGQANGNGGNGGGPGGGQGGQANGNGGNGGGYRGGGRGGRPAPSRHSGRR